MDMVEMISEMSEVLSELSSRIDTKIVHFAKMFGISIYICRNDKMDDYVQISE